MEVCSYLMECLLTAIYIHIRTCIQANLTDVYIVHVNIHVLLFNLSTATFFNFWLLLFNLSTATFFNLLGLAFFNLSIAKFF